MNDETILKPFLNSIVADWDLKKCIESKKTLSIYENKNCFVCLICGLICFVVSLIIDIIRQFDYFMSHMDLAEPDFMYLGATLLIGTLFITLGINIVTSEFKGAINRRIKIIAGVEE